jgi:hypothetical protein
MPVYQYREVGTARVVELVRTVAQRDSVPPGLIRITVPERLTVTGTTSNPIDPTSCDAQVKRAYRQLEDKMPAEAIAKEGGFSVEKIKEVWNL